jgi:methyl-accepting chemotaxis protein WspA
MEMDAFTKSVDTGVIEIGSISQQLAEIISSVKGITEKFQLVAEGTQSQSQGAEQIREAMCLVADEASQSEQALDAFRNATTALHKAAEELKGEITRFTV